MHYGRWRRTGTTDGVAPRGPQPVRRCSVKGCEEPHRAKGYCTEHYQNMRRYGTIDPPPPPPRRGCQEPGCERDHCGHGYCALHLARLKRSGTTAAPPRTGPRGPQKNPRKRRPVAERFWEKVDKGGPPPIDSLAVGNCWVWTAGTNKGYGHFSVSRGRPRGAHIVAWEFENGPLPTGLELDHMCRRPICVRPSHLRAVTRGQNTENRARESDRTVSGVRGVHWRSRWGKWQARVGAGRRQFVGPLRATVEEAAEDVRRMRLQHHTHNDVDRLAPAASSGEEPLPGL